ncbi:NucA/NucB deoxyribonuclease domain-containing protein [Streptomyces sp. B6B3]|uniref:NucA/NucB deoxyribonuclease domain-containing protein n=1 Tax=Streptomyces sp. B6B3 TaxID=3153570 RepID=UPI00325D6D44
MHRSLRVALIGFSALLLLAPVSAQATGASTQDDEYTVPALEVVSDDPVNAQSQQSPPETLEEREELIPEESPEEVRERAELAERLEIPAEIGEEGPLSAAASVEPTDDVTDCQANDQAREYEGLAVGHLVWCSERGVVVVVKDCVPGNPNECVERGAAEFLIRTVGYAGVNYREIEFVSSLSNFELVGDVARVLQAPLTMAMDCTSVGQGSSCDAGSTNGREDTVENWMAAPTTYFYFSSPLPPPSVDNPDFVSHYSFTSRIISGSDNLDYASNGFRCDSASYLIRNDQQGGCVFDLVIETFDELSTDDPAVWEAAVHIFTAQFEPENTLPRKTSKSIPGSPESGQPLTRNYHDTALYQRTQAIQAEYCAALFGRDYSQGGTYQCDEYPFAHTYQSLGSGGDFSLRVITARDNESAGGRWSAWLLAQRILDSDAFYVLV